MMQRLFLCCATLLIIFGELNTGAAAAPFFPGAPEASEDTSGTGDEEPLEFVWRPSIGLGAGMFTFYGDVGKNHRHYHPTVSRAGFELRVSNPLTDEVDLGFYVLRGKLGANERSLDRNLNFRSQVTMGGFTLTYDFGHFLKEDRVASPFISVGFESFEFLSKTDLYDENGNRYYYWDDGSIRDLPENGENAQQAEVINRDYTYETDLRELNLDGFGKYPEHSWAFPVGIGADLKLSDRVNMRFRTQMHFTLTDYVDNVTDESVGDRAGDAANDKFLYTSVSLRYDLQFKKDEEEDQKEKGKTGKELLAKDMDQDQDGVEDLKDRCANTPPEQEVGEDGCPVDTDKDTYPDHMDDQVNTDSSRIRYVDNKGVALTDEEIEQRYLAFIDSTGKYVEMKDTVRSKADFMAPFPTKTREKRPAEKTPAGKRYMVRVGDDQTSLPEDLRNRILSLPGVRTVEQGDTTVYVVGNYKNLPDAVKRQLGLEEEGIEGEVVSREGQDGRLRVVSSERIRGKGSEPSTGGTVFRVQIGAYSDRVSKDVFSDVDDLMVVQGDDGLYRYLSGTFDNPRKAAQHKTEMYLKGYKGAFVSAYRDGERITLHEAGATVKGDKKDELIDETKRKNIDKDLIRFRVQIGLYKDKIPAARLEKMLDMENVQPMNAEGGAIRYLSGSYKTYEEAARARDKIQEDGIEGAFVVGQFKNNVIPAKEALKLLEQ